MDRERIAKNTKYYDDSDTEFKFLLGGIGTGNISVNNRGQLVDFEIFNDPAKGKLMKNTFFCIRSVFKGEKPQFKVLESKERPPYTEWYPNMNPDMKGLPRFDGVRMFHRYPFVNYEFLGGDERLKVFAEMATPFIPLDEDNSGIPAIRFKYTVINISDKPAHISICGSFSNPVGYLKFYSPAEYKKHNIRNERIDVRGCGGVYFTSDVKEDDLHFANMTLLTTNKNYSIRPNWMKGGWFDGQQNFIEDFIRDGHLNQEVKANNHEVTFNGDWPNGNGSVCAEEVLKAGEKRDFEFVLSWYVPNRKRWWDGCETPPKNELRLMKNYYAYQFKDSQDAAEYFMKNQKELEKSSRLFSDALYSSTLPDYVIDAVASNITVLRSPTCFRAFEDGKFFAWEGIWPGAGSCAGTCTHVWNYTQTCAYLFPKLERIMREIEFLVETDEEGYMSFRQVQLLDGEKFKAIPACDGQFGSILRVYREYKFSGDKEFVAKVWDKVKKAMDFGIKLWDMDGDGVLDGKQHNTYDIEFYGMTSMLNSVFFAALKGASELALTMNEPELAEKWTGIYEKGRVKMDRELFNGEYYIQKCEDIGKYIYQYGKGCLSDQLIGQTHAYLYGLGGMFDHSHIKSAYEAVFKYNFLEDFSGHINVERVYAINNEQGVVNCTWREGDRPYLPFVYSDEVFTGIEYQVAAGLICSGSVDKGLKVIKAVRGRHNGKNRNPLNEAECGHHYVRSLASYGVYMALLGYDYDGVKNELKMAPKLNGEDFSAFITIKDGWGVYTQKDGEKKFEVLYGKDGGVKIKD